MATTEGELSTAAVGSAVVLLIRSEPADGRRVLCSVGPPITLAAGMTGVSMPEGLGSGSGTISGKGALDNSASAGRLTFGTLGSGAEPVAGSTPVSTRASDRDGSVNDACASEPEEFLEELEFRPLPTRSAYLRDASFFTETAVECVETRGSRRNPAHCGEFAEVPERAAPWCVPAVAAELPGAPDALAPEPPSAYATAAPPVSATAPIPNETAPTPNQEYGSITHCLRARRRSPMTL